MPFPRFQAKAISAMVDKATSVVAMSPRVARMVIDMASTAKTARGRFIFSDTVHTSPPYTVASI
jgi:hypothetical protein